MWALGFAETKLVQEMRFSTTFNSWFRSLIEFGAELGMQNDLSGPHLYQSLQTSKHLFSLITTSPTGSCMEQGVGCFVSLHFPRICSGFPLAVLVRHGLVSGVCVGTLLDTTSFPPPLPILRSRTSFIAADKI